MRKAWLVITILTGLVVAGNTAETQSQSGAQTQSVRPVGVVAEIKPGRLILHTDAGPNIEILVPDGVAVLRVPPGAKDLKAATKISLGEIGVGDRVFVKGRISDDRKSVIAASLMVMSKTEVAAAQQAEREDWQKRGIGGVVKQLNSATKELTLAVPNIPPTPANPTHPVVVTLSPNAVLLRYAPDSVKFSDAKPAAFDQVKVGDQVRALGTKNDDGSHFTAEKLVSGTFRNIAATVISADIAGGTVTVKDLSTGKPVLVRTNAGSKLCTLPPFVAAMIARFNSGQAGEGSQEEASGGGASRAGAGGFGGRGGMGAVPRDFNQMLEHMPPLALGDLKPGEPLIVVSTEGARPAEVTAIAVLGGVEPILEARPKGSNAVVLGPWNMSMGGGEEGLQ